MIKSLVRKGTALGLVSATVLGTWLTPNLKAIALPMQDILKKLNPIPVFTVADENGAPLVASSQQSQDKVAGVFISPDDANTFVAKLKTENPELGKKVQVVPVSLGEIYKINQESSQKEGSENLNFTYVPMKDQVDLAKSILGEGYKGGVPLFVARGGKENGYITVTRNNQSVVPFFFEKQQLEALIESFKKQKPDLANTVKIEVVPLEGVLAAMGDKKNENEAMLKQIVLVPPQSAIKYVQDQQQQQKK